MSGEKGVRTPEPFRAAAVRAQFLVYPDSLQTEAGRIELPDPFRGQPLSRRLQRTNI